MTGPAAVEITDVSMAYTLDRDRPGSLKEYGIRALKRNRQAQQFWALSGITMTVERGQVFGVIGPNGAGKSTLMKIIARVLPPTGGRVIVRGAVAPMIALGAGFNPELTARENIVIYGTLLGRDPRFMRSRIDAIAQWSGLEDFLDVPTRTYSSGMLARLAFGTATDINPEVLVVDEILAVGDSAFKKKSKERIMRLIGSGNTSVVLVSHALPTVVELADQVMWLDSGRVKRIGEAEEVVEEYMSTV